MAELAYKSPSPGALVLIPSPRRHLDGQPLHTKRAEGEFGRRERSRCREENRKHAGARSTTVDQAGADDTALPPELHDHNSSLRRYPLALNTDGEPYAAETSS